MSVLAMIVLLAVGLTVINIEPRVKRTPINRIYLSVCKELEKIGLCREPGEGPIAFSNRVCATRPELAEPMTELTDLYVRVNYRERSASAVQQKALLRELRLCFSGLKSKLPALTGLRRMG